MATSSPTGPLGPEDLAELERLLEAVPAPLEPLDVMMLDGFLCGVLLQPGQVPPARWLPHVTDIDQARPLPRSYPAQALHDLVARRFAELNRAIEHRQWFDPWVLEPDEDDAGPLETVMPWVAGFAAAVDLLPSVLQTADERVLEGQALLYRAFDPEDLEDADALLAVMAELEPPEDLDEVVEDMVTAVFLLADVTRPQPAGALAEPAPAVARPAPARPVEATRPAAPQRPAPVAPAPAAPARSGGASRPAAGGAVPGRPGGQRAPQRPGQPSAARPTGGFGSAWGSGKPAGASSGKTGGATSGKAGAPAAGKPAGAGKPAARPAGPAGAGGARGPGKPGFKKPQGGGR